MSSALLWIVIPALAGIALILYRRQDSFPIVFSVILSLFLSWMAWQIPIDTVLTLGALSFEIAPNFVLFGRNLTLTDAHRPLLSLVYFSETFWLLGTLVARPRPLFIPVSLLCVSLFIAAVSVDPFLYAALVIALVVLISIPLLSPPGGAATPGILRFLVFQLFAVPFILFTGWLLTGVEASPGNFNLVLRSGVLLALGFVFLMAIFPFHSWLPMLSKEAHPYTFTFFTVLLTSFGGLFILSFLDRYAWLRDNDIVYQLLLFVGTLSVLLGGLWAGTAHNLGRAMAFIHMAALGMGLQALGLIGAVGTQLFFALILPRLLALWVMAVAISGFLKSAGGLSLSGLAETLHSRPLFFGSLVLAIFSLAGIPLFGGFPGQVSLWKGLAEISPLLLITSLLGSIALIGVALRLIAMVLLVPTERKSSPLDEASAAEFRFADVNHPVNWVFLALSVVAILGFGLFSRLFLSPVPALAAMFPQLLP